LAWIETLCPVDPRKDVIEQTIDVEGRERRRIEPPREEPPEIFQHLIRIRAGGPRPSVEVMEV
jgi:hypothetical protein